MTTYQKSGKSYNPGNSSEKPVLQKRGKMRSKGICKSLSTMTLTVHVYCIENYGLIVGPSPNPQHSSTLLFSSKENDTVKKGWPKKTTLLKKYWPKTTTLLKKGWPKNKILLKCQCHTTK